MLPLRLLTSIPSMTLSLTKTLSINRLNTHTSSPLHGSQNLTAGRMTWSVENASYIKKLRPSENMVVTTGLLVSALTSIRIRKNNPHSSLLVFSIVLPLVYHDISEEIPEASRPLITRLYLLWLVLVGTLIVNMVACIFVLTSGGSDGLKDLIASIVYVPAWMGSLVDQQLWTASLQLLLFYRSCYGIGVWLRLRIVMSSSFPVTLGQSIMDI